jgi:hypothetical protein
MKIPLYNIKGNSYFRGLGVDWSIVSNESCGNRMYSDWIELIQDERSVDFLIQQSFFGFYKRKGTILINI